MLSWIFPDICRLCGETCRGGLCPRCSNALPRLQKPICLYCGAPVDGNQADPFRCDNCSAKPRTFSFCRSALDRTEETMRLVHDFKYHGAIELAEGMAPLLAEVWENTPSLLERRDWTLVPVPITRRKLYARGFNQAEELARALSRLKRLPVKQPLQRLETGIRSQTLLSARERWINAQHAYKLKPPHNRNARTLTDHILLVDDVFTTGSTARACAKELSTLSNVRTIGVLTLLRIT